MQIVYHLCTCRQRYLLLSSQSSWIQAPCGVFNTSRYCSINRQACNIMYMVHNGRSLLRGTASNRPNATAYTMPYASILTATFMANIHQHIYGESNINYYLNMVAPASIQRCLSVKGKYLKRLSTSF